MKAIKLMSSFVSSFLHQDKIPTVINGKAGNMEKEEIERKRTYTKAQNVVRWF